MRCWYSGTRVSQKTRRHRRAASSAPGGVIGVVLVVVGKGFDRFLAIARQQYFDFLLRGAQRCLALAGERHAAFESLERFFERHVALLELCDERFELGQRLFEVGQLSSSGVLISRARR